MARQILDNVAPADTLFAASNKINNNFTELYGARYNVKDYGAVEDGATDDTTAIQNAINAAFSNGGGVVVLNDKDYSISSLTLKRGVVLQGQGSWATNLYARAGASTSIISMASAQVRTVGIKGVFIYGHLSNTSQHGLYFQSVADTSTPFDGGLWYSIFEDIMIRDISGTAIWLRGGTSDTMIPNQFLSFRQVRAYHQNTSTSRALQCTGQVGQVNFDMCEFDGVTGSKAGTNVYIGREQNGVGGYVGTNTPYTLNFWGCTSQHANKGFLVDSAKGINISECYFEDLYESIEVQNSAMGVVIDKCRFANAGDNPTNTGYLIKATSSSEVKIRDITDLGATDNHIINSGASVSADGVALGGTSLNPVTSGITLQQNASATLSIYKDNNWLINASATQITNIQGELFPGNLLYLRAYGGTITFAEGGNINLGGQTSPLVVSDLSIATFLRTDLSNASTKWVLQSVSAASGRVNVVTLASDVASTASAAFQDVTGLSFSVVAGTVYRLKALVIFTVSAATIGSAWSITGPATPTQLAFTVQRPSITATYPQPPTLTSAKAYDSPAATTATPETTGNMAVVEGVIQPSANGTVTLRFAPETATASGVVVKAGSTLKYW